MKNTMKSFGIGGMAAVIVFSFAACGSSPSSSTRENVTDGTVNLSSLLRIAPSEIHRWGDHDVTEYSLNPEIRDELMKAVTDAGFQQIWSDTETRDWDLERAVLRWCASADPERWAHELRYSAVGERTLHKYGFKPMPGVYFSIDKDSPLGNISLDSLLRIAPTQIENWGGERDNTIYFFNLEIKDALMQAVTDAGFVQDSSWEDHWDLERSVLRWIVSPNPERWAHELRYSAVGETTEHCYNFRPIPTIPDSDDVPKTIIITGYSPQGTIWAGLDLSQTGIEGQRNEARASEVISGQTITYTLGIVGNLPWTGTGEFFITFYVGPSPHDPSKGAGVYFYSEDGTNPTQVDIKDAVTTLEWSKFVWIRDYNPG